MKKACGGLLGLDYGCRHGQMAVGFSVSMGQGLATFSPGVKTRLSVDWDRNGQDGLRDNG